jgi:hypothetical protein
MAMDVPTQDDTEEPESDDDSNSALGFAGTESAKSSLEPTVLDRIPRLHLLLIGFALGNATTALLALLVDVAL